MRKIDEIEQPASGLNKARAEEPLFVLRAKDPLAPAVVRTWANNAEATGAHEPEKIAEARALADAAARGVHVRVVLDKSQPSAQGNQIAVLRAAKIPVWIDHAHAIAHNKVVLVDGRLVETGSFNFTAAAEDSNAENALLIDDPQLEAIYAAEFERHVAHSEAFP